jgi:cytochrome c peroxidase
MRIALVAALAASTLLGRPAGADESTPAPAKRETVTSGAWPMTLPLGLQADSAYIPEDNPLSADKIALGKFLYFDRRLSSDMSISCASCHNPFHGFADPDRQSCQRESISHVRYQSETDWGAS